MRLPSKEFISILCFMERFMEKSTIFSILSVSLKLNINYFLRLNNDRKINAI